MTSLFRTLFAATLSVAVARSACATDVIEIETRFFEISAKTAAKSKLLSEPRPEGTVRGVIAEKNWRLVMENLAHQRGVDLLSAPRVTTKSGQAAKIEVIREFRYPTTLKPDKKRPGEFIASDYTTRNLGVTVVVTTRLAKGSEIALDINPQLTELLGFKLVTTGKFLPADTADAPLGERLNGPKTMPEKGWQPIFATRSVKTKVLLDSGSTLLLGGLRRSLPDEMPKPKTDRLLFIAVTARAVPATR
jgi:type II secretory pathway component GspD/PulD (secretin)